MKMIPAPLRAPTDTVMALHRRLRDDDVAGAAAELSYRFFLALFPFLICLASLGGFIAEAVGVENPADEIMNQLGDTLPSDAASVLRTQIEEVVEGRNVGLVSVGIVGALFAASGGIGTIMKASNQAYELKETRPLWKRYAVSLALTGSGGLLLIVASVVFIAGQVYGVEIADELGMGDAAAWAFAAGRWPAVLVVTLMGTAILYWAAPSKRPTFRWITPGAVVFALGWLAVSYGFGLYVEHFSSYNATYGTLGGVVVILVWFYLTGFILLTGIEINAMLEEAKRPQRVATEAAAEAPAVEVRPTTS